MHLIFRASLYISSLNLIFLELFSNKQEIILISPKSLITNEEVKKLANLPMPLNL